MKYLLSSVAIVAALAFALPASAQRTGPGAGASQTTGPGVTPPGGPGPSSPLSNLPAGSPGLPPQAPSAYPPVGPGAAPGTYPGSETTSAYPPTHRHARHYAKHHYGRPAEPVSGSPNNSANQLNADELARLQSGNYGNPPSSALPYGQATSPGGPPPYGQAPGPGTPPPAHY